MQSIQLISRIEDNKWWKELFLHYASKGESFEIRCWNDEEEIINKIRKFGTVENSQNTKEVIIKGYVNNKFIDFIIKEPMPLDQNIYNKMTQFFTINIDDAFSSAHYGTEIYIEKDEEYAKKILDKIKEYYV